MILEVILSAATDEELAKCYDLASMAGVHDDAIFTCDGEMNRCIGCPFTDHWPAIAWRREIGQIRRGIGG